MKDGPLINDPTKFYICAEVTRKGVQLFSTKLEYTYYPPRTPKNEEFNLNIVQWQELIFYVIEVPMSDKAICHSVAESLGMRIDDGTPVRIASGTMIPFSFQGENVWTLEGQFVGNENQEVSKIFDNDQKGMMNDFQVQTQILHAEPKELDSFMESAIEFHQFSPIMAILFGGERRTCVNECFVAIIQEKPFAVCTISHKGEQGSGQPAIVGLYVIPRARRLGIGTKLFKAALQHCISKKLTPVRVDAMSNVVTQIIRKLPPVMAKHLKVNLRAFDLTSLEQPYIANREWFVSK